jgi:hypothetical protein
MNPSSLTSAQLIALAQSHIRRYDNLIAAANSGHPGIRVDECVEYLRIWTDTLSSAQEGRVFDSMSGLSKWEVRDAIESGEYDEMLGVTS